MELLAAIISFLITLSTLPIIIRLFKSINLIDSPDRRKIHTLNTPSLGGISIYFSILLAIVIVVPLGEVYDYKFLLAGIAISLILGIRDDISSLYANQKLVVQILAAYLVTNYAGIKITSFHGVLGIEILPDWLAISVSIFIIVALTNSFNLIDGIDGLAGSICVIASSIFGVWFLQIGNQFLSVLSFSLAAGIVAFLIYNWQPSKIFMGDTGSLVTGFTLACLGLVYIKTSGVNGAFFLGIKSSIALTVTVLILPIYDTLRVFSLRILKGGSPFVADRIHIHHILIRQNLTHGQATLVLVGYNLVLISCVFLLDFLGNTILMMSSFIGMIVFGFFWDRRLHQFIKRHKESGKAIETGLYINKSA